MRDFSELELDSELLRAIEEIGYSRPTVVQAQAIPHALDGKDVMASAPTGTGKTAAFLLPMIQHLMDFPRRKPGPARVLVLTPTRELAIQVADHARALAKYTDLKIFTITGGISYDEHAELLGKTQDIVVATPGRLMEYIEAERFDCRAIECLILDEADRMLDMGFIHDIRKILRLIPVKRQTLFFSATMPTSISNLAKQILNKPTRVDISPVSSTVEEVKQSLYFIDKSNKRKLLIHLLQNNNWNSILVFSRTKHGADKIAKTLNKQDINTAVIHGNKSQNARQKALIGFKNNEIRVLIATDIAARGIDIDKLSLVINFDVPNIPETYVHRIGRTGRAGQEGEAITFCDKEEAKDIRNIEKLIQLRLIREKEFPFAESFDYKTEKKVIKRKEKSFSEEESSKKYHQRKNWRKRY